MNILEDIKNNLEIKKCLSLSANKKNQTIYGLGIGEKSFFTAIYGKGSIIVVNDFTVASNYKNQILSLNLSVQIVSSGFDNPLFVYSQDLTPMKKLIRGVSSFNEGDTDVLIILCEALVQRLPDSSFFKSILFEKEKNYSHDALIKKLLALGYRRVEIISAEGEFAVRGDIVDIFNIGDDHPVRFDFFGDEIEKIYYFNIEDMSQVEELNSIKIYPATIFQREKNFLIEKIKKTSKNSGGKIQDTIANVIGNLEHDCNGLNNAFTLVFDEYFKNNILGICNAKQIFFDEPKKLIQSIDLIYFSNQTLTQKLILDGLLLQEHLNFYFPKETIFNSNDCSLIAFSAINNDFNIFKNHEVCNFRCGAPKKYLLDYKLLVEDLKLFIAAKQKVVLFAGDKSAAETLSKFLYDSGIFLKNSGVYVIEKELFISVNIWQTNIILISTNDLIKKSSKISHAKKKNVFYLPKVGEYVVHEFHGVGKCVAIERLKLAGSEKDYFVILYDEGAKLYIPSEQAQSISAFVGMETEPKLNKIGGLEFAKVKERAKKGIAKLAIDLISLYKERESVKGFRFEPDSYLQEEFENNFEFDETPDQLEAIFQIKNDMCSSKVMDRLICGDVGYGKTEVALRAAYKAILSGKQVAFLCPTTILAEQHFKTCQRRFKDFMVSIAVLNRLVPLPFQKEIIKKIGNGEVNLIVGTHRLLSSDVKFNNLGLLILDEEQRFGVGDKEKIKNLKKTIDVLTLSATPIPRTLHMSLSGIRDISIIETPPKNRLPVQTFVCEFNYPLVSDVCQREISRGGQVFIVYNRIDSIFDFANKVKELLPGVSVGIAHGRMSPKILEDTVLKLYNGQYQIFIATTLIENGIDIPLANTLIVIDSDKLGLSSLYQLKGRVGRSNRLAYAYFTYQKDKVLTEEAYKRLEAITQFSELGSGFKIAMRDLEIRGAGSVLGREQHGHIEKVGYDLYCRLLDETVSQLKGEIKKVKKEIKIDIGLNAYISKTYISDENERIKLYTAISNLTTKEDAEEIKKIYSQSFGEIPKEIENLIKIALIKNFAQEHNISRILVNEKACSLFLYKEKDVMNEFLSKALEKNKSKGVLKFDTMPIIEFDLRGFSINEKCDFLLSFFSES